MTATHPAAGMNLLLLTFMCIAMSACGAQPLLFNVAASNEVITPDGLGDDDVALIQYELSRPAHVSIVLTDAAGRAYPFRQSEPRAPGSYLARFAGAYAPDPGRRDRRVLPNGHYTYAVIAEADGGGANGRAEGSLEVRNADTTPPLFQDVSALPELFSPNGDNVDDESLISYTLTKAAWVTVFVDRPDGVSYLLEPEAERIPRLYPLRWDGTAGGRLLSDGAYTIRIRARDTAGNLTEHALPMTVDGGGRPMLEITAVRFSPLAMPVGGILTVEITVKNTGESPLRSLGPDPGTRYDTVSNFAQFMDDQKQPLFYERPGYWRAGIGWENAPSAYPVRWGWGDKLLLPGEETTVTGTIQLVGFRTPYVQFWAGVIQEGVGYPGGAVGHKRLAISY